MDMHLDNDDEQIVRILSRRRVLTLIRAAAGAMLLAACAPGPAATPAPTSAPAQAAAPQQPLPTLTTQARATATAAQTPEVAATVAVPT